MSLKELTLSVDKNNALEKGRNESMIMYLTYVKNIKKMLRKVFLEYAPLYGTSFWTSQLSK